MKRALYIMFVVLSGGLLLVSAARAGVNYISYHEQFKAANEAPSDQNEGKRFYHRSKYSREQEKGQCLPQPAEQNTHPAGKHDH